MLPENYTERVYAGVLGKVIGVYLGRPFEQWRRADIQKRLGEIEYYVNEELGQPLVVADDDISGTFTFLRALEDNDFDPNLTPAQIGETWLNYIVENRTVLWWGGMSTSTEHTAYLRLKSGIKAPSSGSIETNRRTVAEQIGAQIFIDGWGLIHPGDPAAAADWARRAASVSHDGEAIHGAQVIASLIAAAFVEQDIDKMLDLALAQIPSDCLIRKVADFVRDLVARVPDWREGFGELDYEYGYERFQGECHIVPNHALVLFALLHGKGDWQESMRIVNSCGWDTDCNAGNLGCILGVKGGLRTFEGGPDWRGPVADRVVIPTADGGGFATDTARLTAQVVYSARRLRGEACERPKRFEFGLRDCFHGFVSSTAQTNRDAVVIDRGNRRPAFIVRVAKGVTGKVGVPVFILPEQRTQGGYGLLASPAIYPGQRLRATLAQQSGDETTRPFLFVRRYGPGDQVIEDRSETGIWDRKSTSAGLPSLNLEWDIPGRASKPVFEVGIGWEGDHPQQAIFDLVSFDWDGIPTCEFARPTERGEMWLRQWVNGLSELRDWNGMDCVQNEGTGLAIVGCREWKDYSAGAQFRLSASKSAGLAVHVQGLRRYYALVLEAGKARLVKARDGVRTLAEIDFATSFDDEYRLRLDVKTTEGGVHLIGFVDGQAVFEYNDAERPLESGALGIVVTEGRALVEAVQIRPYQRY